MDDTPLPELVPTSLPRKGIRRLALVAALLTPVAVEAQYLESFLLPAGAAGAGLAEGPDGKLWVTDSALGRVFRIARDSPGTPEATFTLPAGWSPGRIVAGPGGALWFTIAGSGNRIGRITTGGTVTDFPLPTAAAQPVGIAVGPDGNLWFTESAADKIGRITPAGAITEFQLSNPGSQPWEICAGPDGGLWFSENGGPRAGRISTTGTITETNFDPFPFSHSEGIACDASQGVWVSLPGLGSRLVRLSGADAPVYSQELYGLGPGFAFSRLHHAYFTTNVLSEVELGRLHPESGLVPMRFAGVTTGAALQVHRDSDGDLWWIDGGRGLGRITTGSGIEEYRIDASGLGIGGAGLGLGFGRHVSVGRFDLALRSFSPDGTVSQIQLASYPGSLTLGPDGNLWLTDGLQTVIRRTPQGVETPFPVSDFPDSITVGKDGNLWFTQSTAPAVGRLTPQGQLASFALPGGSEARGLAVAGDGSLWTARPYAHSVTRVSPAGVATDIETPTPGSGPCGAAGAPDGAVWFVECSARKLLRATAGGVLTELPTELSGFPAGGIAVDPTGRLWWTAEGNPQVGVPVRVCHRSPSGSDTCTALSTRSLTQVETAQLMVVDDDGNPWVLVARQYGSSYLDTVARIEAGLFRNGFESGGTGSWSGTSN